MFDFSHGPNQQLPIHTECLGLSKFFKRGGTPTLMEWQKQTIGKALIATQDSLKEKRQFD